MSEIKYAYSFNREEYEGPFNSYDEALQEAKNENEALGDEKIRASFYWRMCMV